VDRVTAWNKALAQEIVREHLTMEGAALPIFHALQGTFGFIHEEAISLVAEALNITRAEAYGIVTFYHDFRHERPGRHLLKLCRAEACQSMGGDALAEHAQAQLGTKWGETSRDGAVTLEPVFCLGLCACAPTAMIDGEVVGRLDRERLDTFLEGAKV
jgi:formate dehydrogenase subunit gamma